MDSIKTISVTTAGSAKYYWREEQRKKWDERPSEGYNLWLKSSQTSYLLPSNSAFESLKFLWKKGNDKKKKQGLPWWSRSLDPTLPIQGPHVDPWSGP